MSADRRRPVRPAPRNDHGEARFPTTRGKVGRVKQPACTKYPEIINVN